MLAVAQQFATSYFGLAGNGGGGNGLDGHGETDLGGLGCW
jgi:hypothetical protein